MRAHICVSAYAYESVRRGSCREFVSTRDSKGGCGLVCTIQGPGDPRVPAAGNDS